MANETPAVRETLSRDAELLEPLASEAAAEAPPMAPAFVMGPDGLMYPAPTRRRLQWRSRRRRRTQSSRAR